MNPNLIILSVVCLVLIGMANGVGAVQFSKVNYNTSNYGYVIISSDDASSNIYDNISLALNNYNLVGQDYLITNYISSTCGGTFICNSQVEELANNGFGVGSHTANMAGDTQTQTLSYLITNLLESNSDLSILGATSNSFAYPLGLILGNIIQAVVQVGYKTAVSTVYANSISSSDNIASDEDILMPYSYARMGIDDSVPFDEEKTFYSMINETNSTKGFSRFLIHSISSEIERLYFNRLLGNITTYSNLKTITENDAWGISVERIINKGVLNSTILVGNNENVTLNLEPFVGTFNLTFSGYKINNTGTYGGLETGELTGWSKTTSISLPTLSTATVNSKALGQDVYEGNYALNLTNMNQTNDASYKWTTIDLGGQNKDYKTMYCSAMLKIVPIGYSASYTGSNIKSTITQYNTSGSWRGDTGDNVINVSTNQWYKWSDTIITVQNADLVRPRFTVRSGSNMSLLIDNMICTFDTTDIYTNYVGKEISSSTGVFYPSGELQNNNGTNGDLEWGNITGWSYVGTLPSSEVAFDISNVSYNGLNSLVMNSTNQTNNLSIAWKSIRLGDPEKDLQLMYCSFRLNATILDNGGQIQNVENTNNLVRWTITQYNTSSTWRGDLGSRFLNISTNEWYQVNYAIRTVEQSWLVYTTVTILAKANMSVLIDDMICTFDSTNTTINEEPTGASDSYNITVDGTDVTNVGFATLTGGMKYNVSVSNANLSGIIAINVNGTTTNTMNYNVSGGAEHYLRDELSNGIIIREYPVWFDQSSTASVTFDYTNSNNKNTTVKIENLNANAPYSDVRWGNHTIIARGADTVSVTIPSGEFVEVGDYTCDPDYTYDEATGTCIRTEEDKRLSYIESFVPFYIYLVLYMLIMGSLSTILVPVISDEGHELRKVALVLYAAIGVIAAIPFMVMLPALVS